MDLYESCTDPRDTEKISQQFRVIESLRDFIEWLFDHSGEIDHITQTEAIEKYEKWLDQIPSRTKKKKTDENQNS